jgi:hypothetical protein
MRISFNKITDDFEKVFFEKIVIFKNGTFFKQKKLKMQEILSVVHKRVLCKIVI